MGRGRALIAGVVALVVVLGPTTGCSFLFTRGGPPEVCSTSRVPPGLDSVFAGFQVIRVGVAAAVNESYYDDFPLTREVDILLGLGFSALFIASAHHGFSTTAECEESKLQDRPSGSADEARDYNVAHVPPAPAATPEPPRREVIRSEIYVDDWKVQLLGVPAEDRNTVAVRVLSSSSAPRFEDCDQLATVVGEVASPHPAKYQSKSSDDEVQEAVVARVSVDALNVLAEASDASLAVCDERKAFPEPMQAHLQSFLDRFAQAPRPAHSGSSGAEQRARPEAVRPQPVRGSAEVDVSLVLEGFPVRLRASPSEDRDRAVMVFPVVRADGESCAAVSLTVDGERHDLLLETQGGAPRATVPVSLLQEMASSAESVIDACGHTRKLGHVDRRTVEKFLEEFMKRRGADPVEDEAPRSEAQGQPESHGDTQDPSEAEPPPSSTAQEEEAE